MCFWSMLLFMRAAGDDNNCAAPRGAAIVRGRRTQSVRAKWAAAVAAAASAAVAVSKYLLR